MYKFAQGLLCAGLVLLASCENQSSISSSDQASAVGDNSHAARLIRIGWDAQAFWPNGIVPFYLSPEITNNAPPKNMERLIRQSIAQWEAGSAGTIKFMEVSSTNPGPKLKITYTTCQSALAGGVRDAMVLGTPASGMTLCLDQRSTLMNALYNDGRALNPSTTIFDGRYSALRIISHEFGHVLGLLHEDGHPNFRNTTHAVASAGASGCPADPYVSSDFGAGTVVPDESGNAIPDFSSIMEYGFVNCTNGYVRFYKNADNTPVNFAAGDTGAISSGDYSTVRAIYSAGRPWGTYWSPALSIKTEYIVAGSSKTSIEQSIGSNIRESLNRWVINLDPSIGAISKIGPTNWVAPTDAYSGPTIRVGVDLANHAKDYSITCNPSNPTNFCLITLYDALDASGGHLLTNKTYVTNILQAAFGLALGLGASDPNSAVYYYNDLTSKNIVPTSKDIASLSRIYNSSTRNFAPLIRLKYPVTSGVVKFDKYVTSWESVQAEPSWESLVILGRVPLFGGTVAGTAPGANSSYINVGQYGAMGQLPFYTLWGKTSVGSLASTSSTCPQEAKDKALAIVAKGTLGSAAIFNTPQPFASVALTAYWDNAGRWIMAPGLVIGKSCQFTVGYIAN